MPMLQVELEITSENKDVPLSGCSCVYFLQMPAASGKKKKSVASRLKEKISWAEPSLSLSICREYWSLSLLTGCSLSHVGSGNLFSTLCSLTSAVNKSKSLWGTNLQGICSLSCATKYGTRAKTEASFHYWKTWLNIILQELHLLNYLIRCC